MKANYLLKHALATVTLFSVMSVFGQTVVQPTFMEVERPVFGNPFLGMKEDIKEGDEVVGEKDIVPENGDGRYRFGFSYECAVAWGDYNNDGFKDVMISGHGHQWSRNTHLYQNKGDGTFTLLTETPFPGLNASSITWFDYNNDGNLDVFLAGYCDDGRYSGLWKNLGAAGNYEFEEVCIGEFTYLNNEGGNKNNRYVAVADYDNDGWVDLYMQGHLGDRRYSGFYKNINGERFEEVNPVINSIAEGFSVIQMNGGGAAWGDSNNDGYLDLIATGYWDGIPDGSSLGLDGGYIRVLYVNNGDGTFTGKYYQKLGTEGNIRWLDYDNNGHLDYMLQGAGWFVDVQDWRYEANIYHNPGNSGEFELLLTSGGGVNGLKDGKSEASVDFGDLNNDGFEDVLFMNADPNAVFFNNYGDGTFSRMDLQIMKDRDGIMELSGYNQWGGTACTVDFDNDGDLDLFTAAYGEDPILQRNDLSGEIGANEAPSIPTNLEAVTQGGITTFTWNESTDDLGSSVRYNLYIKYGNIIKSILPADLTTGRLKVNEMLAPLTTNSYKISGLPADFTWGVQSIDNAKLASVFATAIVGEESAIKSTLANQINILTQKGAVKITSTEDIAGQIAIFNVSGVQVYSATTTISNVSIELPAGIYVVKVTTTEGALVEKVIVK